MLSCLHACVVTSANLEVIIICGQGPGVSRGIHARGGDEGRLTLHEPLVACMQVGSGAAGRFSERGEGGADSC